MAAPNAQLHLKPLELGISWFISLIVLTTSAVVPMVAQSTKTTENQPQLTKAVSALPESPEHAFARNRFESAKHEFEESQKDYNEKFRQDTSVYYDGTRRCNPASEVLFRHPVTRESVGEHMVGCNYETKNARFVMERVAVILAQLKTQLDDVDHCLKIYYTTIDKKMSDQTTREVGQIKACQAEDLYPPRTK